MIETLVIAFCFSLPWLIIGFIFTITDMKTSYKGWLEKDEDDK
jgi:hypothetical protein